MHTAAMTANEPSSPHCSIAGNRRRRRIHQDRSVIVKIGAARDHHPFVSPDLRLAPGPSVRTHRSSPVRRNHPGHRRHRSPSPTTERDEQPHSQETEHRHHETEPV